MDISRFIDGPLYSLLLLVIDIFWAINRFMMLATLQVDKFNEWILDNAETLIDLVAAATYSPAGVAIVIAFTLYGLWRISTAIFPDMPWKPVELPKAIMYAVAISLFFAAPAAGMVALDQVRTQMSVAVQNEVLTNVTADLAPDGYTSSEPPVVISSLTTSTNAVGVNVAAGVLRVIDADELGSIGPPQGFQDEFTPNDVYEYENLNPDDRIESRGIAFGGLIVYIFSPLVIFYALLEVILWMILNLAVVILWIGLPIALVFAPFTASEGIFKSFIAKYSGVFIETIVSSVLVGLANTIILYTAQFGIGLMVGMTFLSIFLLIWRIVSAAKIASSAVDTIGGSSVTGGVGLSQGARAAAGATAAVAGAALTGGATLGLSSAESTLKSMQRELKNNPNPSAEAYAAVEAQENRVNQWRQSASFGGYVAGHSKFAAGAMGKLQEMRLASGEHNPARDGVDAMDAAYMGSRLSSGGPGSATYLTTSMMGGPINAFNKLGYETGVDGSFGLAGMTEDGLPLATGSPPRQSYGNLQNGTGNGLAHGRSNGQTSRVGLNKWSDVEGAKPAPVTRQSKHSDGAEDEDGVDSPAVAFHPETSEKLNDWVDKVERADTSYKSGGRGANTAKIMRDSLVGQAETTYHRGAGQVADLVGQHGGAKVKEAMAAARKLTARYKSTGMSDASIVQKFESGEAFEDARFVLPDRTSNAIVENRGDFNQLAAFTLRPTTHFTGPQLVAGIGQAVNDTAVTSPEQIIPSVNQKLGISSQLGGYTGTVRGIVQISKQMGINGAQLQNAYTHQKAGETERAYRELAQGTQSDKRGVEMLMRQLETLPNEAVLSRDMGVSRG